MIPSCEHKSKYYPAGQCTAIALFWKQSAVIVHDCGLEGVWGTIVPSHVHGTLLFHNVVEQLPALADKRNNERIFLLRLLANKEPSLPPSVVASEDAGYIIARDGTVVPLLLLEVILWRPVSVMFFCDVN